MPLTIKPSSGSGSITLQATTGTTTNDTLTLPAKTGNIITSADSGTVTQTMLQVGTSSIAGVVGTGPALLARKTGSTQAVTSNVYTKVQLAVVTFDTASRFDNTTNYRYTPNVAGYYQLSYGVYGSASGTSMQAINAIPYLNGAAILGLEASPYIYPTAVSDGASTGSTLTYMNGTSDYLELWGKVLGTSPNIVSGFMSAVLVRAG